MLVDYPDGITEKHLRALSGEENAPHTWKAFPSPARKPSVEVAEAERL